MGGLRDTDLDQCLALDSGCDAFKDGYCDINDDSLIAEIQGHISVKDCQVIMSWIIDEHIFVLIDWQSFQLICQRSPGCQYFYKYFDFCQLFSEDPFEDCDSVAGPTNPSLSNCQSDGSTTTTTTSTTPSTTESTTTHTTTKITTTTTSSIKVLFEFSSQFLVKCLIISCRSKFVLQWWMQQITTWYQMLICIIQSIMERDFT